MMSGKNLLSSADLLTEITLHELFDMIRSNNTDLAYQTHQLSTLRGLDNKMYSAQKRRLPYFICCKCNPPYRKGENFSYINSLVLDLDNLSEKNIDIDTLRNDIVKDERVALCYISPSQDGLKVLFQLSENCYDPGLFSMFYKQFAHDFSKTYNLDQVIDLRTSDVVRACFISHDEKVYLNDNPIPLDISCCNEDNYGLSLYIAQKEGNEWEKQIMDNHPQDAIRADPDSEILDQIKNQLALSKRKSIKSEIPVYVPEVLNEVLPELSDAIESFGISIDSVIDIQFGKKIKVSLGRMSGEVNVFYGKKGFSVVQTPKRTCSAELNQILADLIKQYLSIG